MMNVCLALDIVHMYQGEAKTKNFFFAQSRVKFVDYTKKKIFGQK